MTAVVLCKVKISFWILFFYTYATKNLQLANFGVSD